MRRLDTRQVLDSGILYSPAPETDLPVDRERFDASGDSYAGTEAVIAALETGKLVEAPNYYGVLYAWKGDDGMYHGTLLQYRSVTEDPTFATAEDAEVWFHDTYHSTDG